MYKIKTSDFFNNTIDKELLNIDIVKNVSQDSFISKYSNLYVVYSLSFKIEFCFKENMNVYYIMVEKFLEQNRENTLLEYEDDLLIFDKTKDEIEKKIGITINNDNIKLNNIELYFSEEEIDSLYFFDNS